MDSITFLHPEFFYLLILIPVMIFYSFWTRKKHFASFTLSSTRAFGSHKGIKAQLVPILWILRALTMAFLIIAMARPQSSDIKNKKIGMEGIDIMIAQDISGSMLAQDFKPDRLGASKNVAREFIDGRPNDRIGLTIYAEEGFTQCPLTTDHVVLKGLLSQVDENSLPAGRTAIGMGLATAVSRLKESTAKSKVIILLTDGENLAGEIEPLTAAELASTFNIKVYTIGVGTNGFAPYPAIDFFGRRVMTKQKVVIDEKLLKEIASITNGKYFRATDNDRLKEIYKEIDELEKSKINELNFKKFHDEFYPLVLVVLILFGLEILLAKTYFRSAL